MNTCRCTVPFQTEGVHTIGAHIVPDRGSECIPPAVAGSPDLSTASWSAPRPSSGRYHFAALEEGG